MGILGVVGVVIGLAVAGLVAFGVLMIYARGMSDVPLDSPKPSNKSKV